MEAVRATRRLAVFGDGFVERGLQP